MTYTGWFFGLLRREQDGATRRAHLEHAARRGNAKAQAALVAPPLRARFVHLWHWFQELHGARGSGMNGPAPITWPDLDAWARRTRRDPSPWECTALKAMDGAFFATVTAE